MTQAQRNDCASVTQPLFPDFLVLSIPYTLRERWAWVTLLIGTVGNFGVMLPGGH